MIVVGCKSTESISIINSTKSKEVNKEEFEDSKERLLQVFTFSNNKIAHLINMTSDIGHEK